MPNHLQTLRSFLQARLAHLTRWARASPFISNAGKIGEWVGKVAIFAGIVSYVFEAGDRAKQRHYQAWQIIVTAPNLPGDAGRRSALNDLVRDGVELTYLDLSSANLDGADLRGAQLSESSFAKTNLTRANFGCRPPWSAEFLSYIVPLCQESSLVGAKFFGNNLKDSIFTDARLTSSVFGRREENPFQAELIDGVDFRRADLNKAIFAYSYIVDAKFTDAKLQASVFDHVEFRGNTTFSGADLRLAVFYSPKFSTEGLFGKGKTDFTNANLTGAYVDNHPATPGDFSDVKLCNTTFGKEISQRNCK